MLGRIKLKTVLGCIGLFALVAFCGPGNQLAVPLQSINSAIGLHSFCAYMHLPEGELLQRPYMPLVKINPAILFPGYMDSECFAGSGGYVTMSNKSASVSSSAGCESRDKVFATYSMPIKNNALCMPRRQHTIHASVYFSSIPETCIQIPFRTTEYACAGCAYYEPVDIPVKKDPPDCQSRHAIANNAV